MTFLYATLFKARTTQAIDDVVTSFTVDDTSKLPVLDAGQYFVLELKQGSDVEFMHCTAVTGSTLTVIRGRETTPVPKKFRTNCLVNINIDPYGYELITTGGGSGLTQQQVLALNSLRV